MSILITGASGRLGSELTKHISGFTPSRREMDITDEASVARYASGKPIDLIVHCAGYTNVTGAEKERELCYTTNVIGTLCIAKLRLPTIHISTDGVFSGEEGNYSEEHHLDPCNFYNFTKCMAEMPIRMLPRYVILRFSFRMRPFQYEKAWTDKFSSADYVDVLGKHVGSVASNFSNYPNGAYHLGRDRQSIFELARETRDVEPMSFKEIQGVRLQKDSSLNLSKWRKLCNQ